MKIHEFLFQAESRGYPARSVGDGWLMRCPAHNDSRPSLRVSFSEGRILLYCRSRHCPTESIVRALGVKMSDLFENERGYDLSECRFRLSQEQYDALSEAEGDRIHDAQEKPEDVMPIWRAMARTEDDRVHIRDGHRYLQIRDSAGAIVNVLREDGTIWPFGGWAGVVGNVAALPKDRPMIMAGDFLGALRADVAHWRVPLPPEGEPELESGYSLGLVMAALRPATIKLIEFPGIDYALRDAARLGIEVDVLAR